MKAVRLLSVIAAVASVTLGTPVAVHAQSTQRIQLTQIEAMFSDMRARAPWNVDGPLLWGYFFFDPSEQKLRNVAKELEKSYRVVSVAEVPGRRSFRLHVEKVEVHTPASLHARNSEFYELAARFGLASYDGMDVGPVPR
jgi:hypothetical protein